jgi:hypothetical protein
LKKNIFSKINGFLNIILILDAYIAKWFLGSELSLALGLSVGSANLGSAIASIT